MTRTFLITPPILVAAGLLMIVKPDAVFADSSTATSAAIDQVVEAERAFAADSTTLGIKRSFLKYAAHDSVIFRPRPVPAIETLLGDPDDDVEVLDWWPAYGAMSRSADLALSVGPWVLSDRKTNAQSYGYYATIWRKQPDGVWKFVIDGAGARLSGEPSHIRGAPVVNFPVAGSSPPKPVEEALQDVRALEMEMSADAALRGSKAIAERLHSTALLMGSNVEPKLTPLAMTEELDRRPQRMSFVYLGGGASAAGDLVYTYGTVAAHVGEARLPDASYLHVWQLHDRGWRLIFQGIKSPRRVVPE